MLVDVLASFSASLPDLTLKSDVSDLSIHVDTTRHSRVAVQSSFFATNPVLELDTRVKPACDAVGDETRCLSQLDTN
jgi:hypothetical protein